MKVLVIYANAGAGHRKAAEALADTYRRKLGAGQVQLVDLLDYTNPVFKFSYPRIYIFLITRLSLIWAAFFYLLDTKLVFRLVTPLRRFFNWLNSFKLVKFLAEKDFDLIVSTHFFSSEVAAALKRASRLRGRLISIVTDFRVHSFWFAPGVDFYLVAGEGAKKDLVSWGVGEEEIKITGIPIDPKFSIPRDKKRLKEKLEIKLDIFTVLISGGGFGVGPYQELIRKFSSGNYPVQLLVICGHNDKLYDQLSRIDTAQSLHLKLYHFVDNMDELMAASDCLISKSGGLTVSEALARSLPMIILSPVPGQESGNAQYLVDSGAGLIASSTDEAVSEALKLAQSPDGLARIKDNISRIARPNSTEDIVKWTQGR